MNRFGLTSSALDVEAFARGLRSARAGGYASFEGWVRDQNEGRRVLRLEYEAYAAMAVRQGTRIVEEAIAEFGVLDARCVHRVGALGIGDVAVWVGAVAEHREEAFAACRSIIDRVKVGVPIWKKEHYVDGDSGWVNCERCEQAGPHRH